MWLCYMLGLLCFFCWVWFYRRNIPEKVLSLICQLFSLFTPFYFHVMLYARSIVLLLLGLILQTQHSRKGIKFDLSVVFFVYPFLFSQLVRRFWRSIMIVDTPIVCPQWVPTSCWAWQKFQRLAFLLQLVFCVHCGPSQCYTAIVYTSSRILPISRSL